MRQVLVPKSKKSLDAKWSIWQVIYDHLGQRIKTNLRVLCQGQKNSVSRTNCQLTSPPTQVVPPISGDPRSILICGGGLFPQIQRISKKITKMARFWPFSPPHISSGPNFRNLRKPTCFSDFLAKNGYRYLYAGTTCVWGEVNDKYKMLASYCNINWLEP